MQNYKSCIDQFSNYQIIKFQNANIKSSLSKIKALLTHVTQNKKNGHGEQGAG